MAVGRFPRCADYLRLVTTSPPTLHHGGTEERRSSSCREFPGPVIELRLNMKVPTVLVVDDEPLVRWSVAETLGDSGYVVTQAGDALQALESVKATGADVVLLDVCLP